MALLGHTIGRGAPLMELVDIRDLKSRAVRRAGSSPAGGTMMRTARSSVAVLVAAVATTLLVVKDANPETARIDGYREFRFGLTPTEARQNLAGRSGHVLGAEGTGSWSFLAFDGEFSGLPAVATLMFDDGRLKAIKLTYYGSDSAPPRVDASACDALFAKVSSDMTAQCGKAERLENPHDDIHITVLKWHSPTAFVTVREDVSDKECYSIDDYF